MKKRFGVLFCLFVFVLASVLLMSSCKKHEHLFGEWTTVKEATCTEAGEQKRVCECGESETQAIPSMGHTPGAESTCMSAQFCTICNVALAPVKEHSIVTDTEIAPTCTETGLTEGSHCSVCNEILVKQTVVEALGHTEVIDPAVAATCTQSGLTEGKHCSVCKEVLVKQEIVAAFGHTEIIDPSVAATCTQSGLTEGKHCSVCREILVKQTVVIAKGHNLGDRNTCTEAGTCTVCGVFLEAAKGHDYIAYITAPTCTEKGYTTNRCSRCGDTYTDGETAALGHIEVTDEAITPTCTETGLTEGSHCSVCGEILTAQEVISAEGHVEVIREGVEPTCTETGLTEEKVCSVCGEILVARKIVGMISHRYSLDTEIQTESGKSAYSCEWCKACKIVEADSDISDVYVEHNIEIQCEKDFTFDILYSGNVSYIYDHLKIVNLFLESANKDSQVAYQVTKVKDGVWRISPQTEYEEYVSYYAQIDGDLKFSEYTGNRLDFDIDGPEIAEIEFQEGIIFLKALEAESPGYYPYKLIFDENTQRYELTIGKLGALQNAEGQILCVGDYISEEDILNDPMRECLFTVIESIDQIEENQYELTLSMADVDDVYSHIRIFQNGPLQLTEEDIPEGFTEKLKNDYLESDEFAEFMTTFVLAARSYADEHQLTMPDIREKSFWDNLVINPNYKFPDKEDLKEGEPVKITISFETTFEIELGKEGYNKTTLKMTMKPEFILMFDFTLNYSKGFQDLPDFEWVDFKIDQTSQFIFEFHVDLKSETNEEKVYVINEKSLKVHDPKCRILKNIKNEENFSEYTAEKMADFYEKRNENPLDHECGVCRVISEYDGTFFIYNVKTNTLHCSDCVYAKESSKNTVIVFSIPSDASKCLQCNPGTRELPDFDERMRNSMKTTDWGEVLGEINSILSDFGADEETKNKDDSVIGKDGITKDIFEKPIPLAYVFALKIDLDFLFDFDLEATLDYKLDCSIKDSYGIKYENGELKTFRDDPVPSKTQEFDMMGRARCDVGVKATFSFVLIGIDEKIMSVGLTVDSGIYAKLAGVLHFEEENWVVKENYAAAFMELGFYLGLNGHATLVKTVETPQFYKEIPFLQVGYDKIYYAYSEYDKEITVGKRTDLKDLISVKVLDLQDAFDDKTGEFSKDGMKAKEETLNPKGETGKYKVSYKFFNPDGTENTYCKVENGILIVSYGSPDTFDVVMQITVTIDEDLDMVTTPAEFFKQKFRSGGNPAFFLEDIYEVTVHVQSISEGLSYKLSDDGTYYTVTGKGSCKLDYIVIPDTYNGLPVKEIGEKAFYGSKLVGVEIPSSVTKIGVYAFAQSKNLLAVFGGKGLIQISTGAFEECSSLGGAGGYFELSKTVRIIDTQAFYKCKKLTSISIPNGVQTIGYAAFAECEDLESVFVPKTVKTIGQRAFYACESLSSIEFEGTKTQWNAITKGTGWDLDTGFYIIKYLDDSDEQQSFYFVSNGDGTCTITGIGTCTDKDIIIPSTYNGERVTAIGDLAFESCMDLTSVIIPDSVTSIGISAFASCTSLKNVTIPNSVTHIGDYAFSYCSSLTSMTIPSSVTEIGFAVFSSCTSLKSVSIPVSVTSIGGWAFYDCSGLTSIQFTGTTAQWKAINFGENWDTRAGEYTVTCTDGTVTPNEPEGSKGLAFTSNGDGTCTVTGIGTCTDTDVVIPSMYNGEKVTSINGMAFINCRLLTSIEIPNGVTAIYGRAFESCTSLTSVVIPDSVTYIDDCAFTDCSNLTSIKIPNSVMSIGDCAFSYCSSLTSIIIGDSVTIIGDYAFEMCTSLRSVVIPESVMSIGNSAFSYCGSLTEISVHKNNASYCSENGVLFNKAKTHLVCYLVGKTGTSYSIPASVTSIDKCAFTDCSSLTSIIIGDSVTVVDSWAFSGCENLTNIQFNGTTVQWQAIAFGAYWNSGTGNYTVTCTNGTISKDGTVTPNGSAYSQGLEFSLNSDGTYKVTGIGTCTDTDVVIPATYNGKAVTAIGNEAFSGCTRLTSITIPNGVTNIGEGAFFECSGLTNVVIPNSVTSIGEYAFYDCSSLTSVVIPEDMTRINRAAFCGCSSLRSITIPESVTIIGDYAFYSCSNLTNVVIPEGVTIIGEYAFSYCSVLTRIVIPEGVTSIGAHAFRDCFRLTSIVIPNSVIIIGEYAFRDCISLTNIQFTGTTAQWQSIILGDYWNSNTGNYTVTCTNGTLTSK